MHSDINDMKLMTNTDFSSSRDRTPNRMGTTGLALAIGYIILFALYCVVAEIVANSGGHMTDSIFSYLSMVLILNVWLLGLILSILGLRSYPKGKAIAGVIISLLPIILFLFAAIIVSPQISTPIRFENELNKRKTQVIERIKDVRTAQRTFKAKHQHYAEDFDELEQFLYANPMLLNCGIEQLRYIPNSSSEFIMETGFVKTSSNRTGPCIEVRAPYKLFLDTIEYRQEIINLIDEEVYNFNRYPGVKFGSMEEANNEVGNWEE